MASTPTFAARSTSVAQLATSNRERQALDDLIRRELRVSDPSDAQQVARALRERYQADPRAQAIDQEALGLPTVQGLAPAPTRLAAPTSIDVEMAQAGDDIERDLAELCQSNLLKDCAPELRGWAQAIRGLLADGAAAAPFALDTRQRDRVFGVRRQLGDYARLARMVGALNPSVNADFRSLATSLDEAAAVLLVMVGEALANVGYSSGKFLLQVSFQELQARRESVLNALRNLTGSTMQTGGAQDRFQLGVTACLALEEALDRSGHGDLRPLLIESSLARSLDLLVQRASHGSVEGLRALGATADVDIEAFRRLVDVSKQLGNYEEAPALIAFCETLQIFVNAFTSSGGHRLLCIARPTILLYGLYGSGADPGQDLLAQLIVQRGLLAREADRILNRASDQRSVKRQIVLDKVIYDIDRAIDLCAVGESWGCEADIRASACSYVCEAAAVAFSEETPQNPNDEIYDYLNWVSTRFRVSLTTEGMKMVSSELTAQTARDQSGRLRRVVESMSGSCGDLLDQGFKILKALSEVAEGKLAATIVGGRRSASAGTATRSRMVQVSLSELVGPLSQLANGVSDLSSAKERTRQGVASGGGIEATRQTIADFFADLVTQRTDLDPEDLRMIQDGLDSALNNLKTKL